MLGVANPQLKDGYIKISNELFDAFCKTRIAGEARQMLDIIIRKTYGFNKKEDAISLSQFAEISGVKRAACARALRKLKDMNVVITKSGYVTIYYLNKDFESWQTVSKKITANSIKDDTSTSVIFDTSASIKDDTKTSIKKDNEIVSKMIHTKDTITKDNKDKRKEPAKKQPDFITQILNLFCEAYLEIRDEEFIVTNKGKERNGCSKLLIEYKKKNPESDSAKTLIDFKMFYERCLRIDDNFHSLKMAPMWIASNINEIRTLIKGKANGTARSGITEDVLRERARIIASDPDLRRD